MFVDMNWPLDKGTTQNLAVNKISNSCVIKHVMRKYVIIKLERLFTVVLVVQVS